jgi:hypothetical protein
MIRDAAADVVGVVLGLAKEGGEVVVVKSIFDQVALPLRLDEAAVTQDPQLVRYGRLSGADSDRQVPDTERPPQQRVEELCPRRVGQRLERADHQFEDLRLGQGAGTFAHRFGVDRQQIRQQRFKS